MQRFKIDNSAEHADQSKGWDPDIKSMVETVKQASNIKALIQEAFLVYPDSLERIRVVDCKYPHHEIKDGECVLSLEGVKAAYARAKQTGLYDSDENVREHLDRHRIELGLDEKEKRMEHASQSIDRAYALLQEAIVERKQSKQLVESDGNLFVSMMEKPEIGAANAGTPIQAAPANNTQPEAQQPNDVAPVDLSQPAPDNNQPTIPLTNPEPNSDPLTNNPVEGPDDRDQDNLDGNQRKEMYQKFADVMIQANGQNVFGTIFDEDVFKSEYKIVPYEMRYFYRLQNPVSVEVDNLSFIPFGKDLLEAQDKYGLGKKLFVFATKSDKPIFFNMLDKTIWDGDNKVAENFDAFIDLIIQNNGSLPEPDESNDAEVVDTNQPDMNDQPESPADDTQPTDQPPNNVAPVDLSQPSGAPQTAVNTGLEPSGQSQPTDATQPVDLTNAGVEYDEDFDLIEESVEDDSVLDMLSESVFFS